MNKIKNRSKKIMILIAFIVMFILGETNSVNLAMAAEMEEKVYIYYVEDCEVLLKYKGVEVNDKYVEYVEEGEKKPAYCLNKRKLGVGDAGLNDEIVTVQKELHDDQLWRIITNGYPYKTPAELGVANKKEAFTATKEAIYCYIHNQEPNYYTAVGEAGERTLKALKSIIYNANKTTIGKPSNEIEIIEACEDWEKGENGMVYKIYKLKAEAPMENYKIKIAPEDNENLKGIKITDLENNEKESFEPTDIFKVSIPIENLKSDINFDIRVEAKIRTKPVFYGKSSDPTHQDYALAVGAFEDGEGSLHQTCIKMDIPNVDEEIKEPNPPQETIPEEKEEKVEQKIETSMEVKKLPVTGM